LQAAGANVIDPLELTRKLVQIDTTNPPGNEDLAIDILSEILGQAGFELQRHRFASNRSNLIATRRRGNGPALAFTGHVDTVPLGTAPWSDDPFACNERDGRIVGRGVTDMKAGVAAVVTAAVNVAKSGEGGDVVLVITAGEETGCEGAMAMRQDGVELPSISGWVVAEPTSNKLALGHKGALFVGLEWQGKTAHSAMPEQGDNAVYRACEAALSIRDMRLVHVQHPVLGRPTRNVGMFNGGQAPNTVPDRAWLSADIRTVPGMNNADLIEQLRMLGGEKCELSVKYDFPAIWTDPYAPLAVQVGRILRSMGFDAEDPIGMPFFTDASVLAQIAPAPVVVIGPGEPTQAHKTDEWCSVSDIKSAVEIFSRLMGKGF
jgi:succinyl-diaminopimelate desuccinylase